MEQREDTSRRRSDAAVSPTSFPLPSAERATSQLFGGYDPLLPEPLMSSALSAAPASQVPFTSSSTSAQVPQSTNPRGLQAPDPNFSFDFAMLDNTMMDLSASIGTSAPFAQNSISSFDTIPTHDAGFSGISELTPTDSERSTSLDPSTQIFSLTRKSDNFCSIGQMPSRPVQDSGNSQISDGWFSPDDVPPPVRDHL